MYLHLRELLNGKKQKHCDTRLKINRGGETHIQMDSVLIEDTGGNPLCRTIMTDITHRKEN